MDTKDKRVLGRLLAVEETMNVSGARPTSPSHDNITKQCLDTSTTSECGVRAPAASSALAGTNVSPNMNHTSGT